MASPSLLLHLSSHLSLVVACSDVLSPITLFPLPKTSLPWSVAPLPERPPHILLFSPASLAPANHAFTNTFFCFHPVLSLSPSLSLCLSRSLLSQQPACVSLYPVPASLAHLSGSLPLLQRPFVSEHGPSVLLCFGGATLCHSGGVNSAVSSAGQCGGGCVCGGGACASVSV